MNTSLCTLGTPGSRLPSSAISAKPGTVAAPVCAVVVELTIEGTCMCRPALTRRTSTLPEAGAAAVPVPAVPVVAANRLEAMCVLSKATPFQR